MGRRDNTAAASRCRDGAPRDFRLATPHAKGTPSCPLSQNFLKFGAKSGKKFIKNSQKKCKNRKKNLKKLEIQYSIAKNVDDFWLKV